MMAAVFGKVGEFDDAKEEWPQYVERSGHFFRPTELRMRAKRGPFHSGWPYGVQVDSQFSLTFQTWR